ncbi:MAG TPA: sulfotransferase family 2 domain-containing protein [Gammaproteobacteria bacterium]|nr:sulfotransferase family 2 domain-containing protein [Gammaproteobacteria bacterium]
MAFCFSKSLNLFYVPVPKNAGTSMRACLFEIDNGFPYRDMIVNGKTVPLWSLYGSPEAFTPLASLPPGAIKVAIVRDPWLRLVSAYRNRVLFYQETNPRLMQHHGVDTRLSPMPTFRSFVENLTEYRKIPAIAHHTNPQVYFLGDDPAYYDRLFHVERLAELEDFLSTRAGKQIALPRLRKEGPALDAASTEGLDLRAIVAERYASDHAFLARALAAKPQEAKVAVAGCL